MASGGTARRAFNSPSWCVIETRRPTDADVSLIGAISNRRSLWLMRAPVMGRSGAGRPVPGADAECPLWFG
jgi:hypothetical protein